MKEHTICSYCVATEGLKGSELEEKSFPDDESFLNHLEEVHDLIIRRKGETEEEAVERVKAKNPRIGTDDCRCPSCLAKKGDSRLEIIEELRLRNLSLP
jgi:hypothetical protein